ncbi:hypothetical protein BCR43DRAFT_503697 [Syncephalastrum racemosum]|uniref:Uncharacterized protein n=1 Tax=Syncephalastrum racemosum TaxID=13706 RepID=A0A1X2HIT7_SYNRA|nr:hypothetical protein BCR43DRAFT_503697 [Syncephalastrum racemosum]
MSSSCCRSDGRLLTMEIAFYRILTLDEFRVEWNRQTMLQTAVGSDMKKTIVYSHGFMILNIALEKYPNFVSAIICTVMDATRVVYFVLSSRNGSKKWDRARETEGCRSAPTIIGELHDFLRPLCLDGQQQILRRRGSWSTMLDPTVAALPIRLVKICDVTPKAAKFRTRGSVLDD